MSAAPGDGANCFAATVIRHTYIGAQRDYLVDLGADIQLRVLAPLHMRAEPGGRVGVRLPPESCRALAR